jgi:hypothetical protein
MSEERKAQSRTLFVPIEDLDLNTPEGQDELLRRMEVLLATENHNNLDLRAFTALKDTIKAKTDLNVLKLFTAMRRELDEFKSKRST